MDQEHSSLPPSISAPEIASPGNNDWVDGTAVTISGTADCDVPIRIWDWLSPVAMTTTDGDGRWSVTVHDVEVGDHMYCAEAYRDSPACTARSQFVAVRTVSHTRSSAASESRTSHRWKDPLRGFTRGLAGLRRSDSRVGATTQTDPDATRDPADDVQRPNPASLPGPRPPSGVSSGEDTPSDELPATMAPTSLDSLPEPAPVEDPFPVEVRAYRVGNEPQAIETPTQALPMPAGLVDLGAADEVLHPVSPADAAVHVVPVFDAPERIWTERVVVEPSPTVRAIDRGG